MLSKQKASLCEWCECLKCKKIVNNRDLNLHSKQCVEEEEEEGRSGRISKVELNHGYIYQRKLHGIVASVTDGELSSVEQLVSSLPKSTQKSLLYVHPSCLSLCNLSIGQPCIVDGEYVQIVWPCLSVNPSLVGLSVDLQEKLGKKSKDFVLVSSLNQAHLQAESLDLKSTNKKDFYSKDEFKEFLQQEIDGKFFTKGNTFSFHYFGQPCSFTVSDIQGFKEKVEITIPGGCDLEDSLSKKLRNIKISGNGTPNNESETILDSHLKSEKQDKDASLIDNSLMDDSSTAEIDRNMESVKEEMDAESPSTPKTKNMDPRKEETNIESPATPKLNPCKNDSVLLSNSSDNQNQNALSPLGASTPLSKMSEKNIPGFQTLPQNNAKSEFPQSGKIFFKVSSHTKIRVNSPGKKNQKDPKTLKDNSVTFDAIGGLKPQIAALKEIIQLSTVSSKVFASYGLTYPKGILLHGPSGCGKTFLMKAFATEMGCYVTKVSGPNIWSKFYGETEKRLTEIFKTAQERSPSLILMDELDTLCPKRNDSANELEKRVVSTLLSLMDDLSNSTFEKLTLVVAATNKLDLVDAALRRPGRFDQEIEIGIPTAEDRHDILQKLLSQTPNTVLPEELKRISDAAHGFVGADLLAVCKEANLLAIKSQKDKSKFQVTEYHLTSGFNKVQPSAMRQVQLEVPKVRWSDIGGQEEVKQKLKQAIEWPLKHPEVFIRMGIQPPKGILLYGPPGCSKTMIAKALATESGLNFIAIKGPELFNKWVGESEKAVREVFRKARAAAPAVVFFDEIDALAVERGSSSGSSSVEDRVLAQLLTELDGVEKLEDVTVVAATNRPDMIDKALLRPGRIDRIMYVPLPDRKTREEIFRIHMKKMPFAKDVDVENLAEKTERYSGAEVSAVCYEAALFAMEEDFKGEEIQEKHFKKSLEVVQPRITDALIEFYENYEQKSSLHPV